MQVESAPSQKEELPRPPILRSAALHGLKRRVRPAGDQAFPVGEPFGPFGQTFDHPGAPLFEQLALGSIAGEVVFLARVIFQVEQLFLAVRRDKSKEGRF
jgi:hypothetical protein